MGRHSECGLHAAVSQSQNAPGRRRLLHLQVYARPLIADVRAPRKSFRIPGVVKPAYRCGHGICVVRTRFRRGTRRVQDRGTGICGFMTKFIVKIWIVIAVCIRRFPRLKSESGFIYIEVGYIHHAGSGSQRRNITNRHCRQEVFQSIRARRPIGARRANTIAQFLDTRSGREICEVRLTKGRVHASLGIGREHERESNDRHENHGKQHYEERYAAFRFSSR